MSVRSNATAVGAFVLGAIAILIGIVIVFGGNLLTRDTVRLVVFFNDSLNGLSVGAPVKYRGVKIGEVVAISPAFDPKEGKIDIPVIIELQRNAVAGLGDDDHPRQELIASGLRARLDIDSLITGQLYVGLGMHPDTPVDLAPNTTGYAQIPTIPSLQSGLQQTVMDLISDQPRLEQALQDVVELLNAATANGGAEVVAGTLRDLGTLTARLADPNGPLQKSLDALPGLVADLRRTAAGLPPLLKSTETTMTSVDGLITGTKAPVTQTLGEVQGTLVVLRKLSDQLNTLIGQVKAPVAGFAQNGLPNLQGLIDDTDRTVNELSRTLRDLRQNPARFLLGDPAAGGVRLQ
jgi:paraquat-inducible protein B